MLYYNTKTAEVVSDEKTISYNKELTYETNEGSVTKMITLNQRLFFIKKEDREAAGYYPVQNAPLPTDFNEEFDKIIDYNYEVDDVEKVVNKIAVIESISTEEIISFIKDSLKAISNSFSNKTITVNLNVNGTNYTFDADRIAKDNIFTLVQNTAAKFTDTDGNTIIPTVQVRDANNNFIKMTKADLTNLYNNIVSVGNDIYAKKWEIESKLDTLSTETLRNMYLFAKNNPLDAAFINTKWE